MWNKSISLLISVDSVTDPDGFSQKQEEWLGGIPANFKDTTRDDEAIANQIGYSADQNIEIMACNYDGQRVLRDESNGDRYEIKRTYHPDKSMRIVLTCERRERGG